MKRISYLLIAVVVSLSGISCKKFIDVNQDPNNPIDVQEALILAPVEIAVSHSLYSGYAAILAQHYTQTVALNQPVPNDGTYLLINSGMDGDWSNLYVTCLNNLNIMIGKAEADGNTAYAGIGKVLTAFCLGTGTDFWGDMPYANAFKGSTNFTPVYDTQEDIYKTIQSLLDDAIADLAKTSVRTPGGDDFYYNGDVIKWTKLAYTLKARYYMHLSKAPGYSAATQAGLALTALANAQASNDDDFKFPYPGSAGNENPWYLTFLPGSTLVLASYIVDTLQGRNDPRLKVMIAPAQSTGLYTGRQIGLTSPAGDLFIYSIPADFYGSASSYNYIVNYSEALFLKAEATLVTSGYAAAQPIYTDAIKSHMTKLGLDVTSTAVQNYLAARGTLNATNALQRIMEEKAIADFLSVENFTDWRRTGFPTLTKVPNALSEIPRRLLYPQVEKISNPQPQQTATLTDHLWWDK